MLIFRICIVGNYSVFNIQDICSDTVVGGQRKGMGIIHSCGNLRRECITMLIVFHGTDEGVIGQFVVGLPDEWNLKMRVIYRSETAPFVRKTIVRCSVLQRDPDIQRINDIHIFAAVLNIHRTIVGRRNGRNQSSGIRRYAQIAGTCAKAAVGDEVDSIVGLPVIAG